ncbi:ATP-binding protein [Patescibacteria group bacterium]|nr:ATP-binding protein [Patescibacteria group bacterium]
MIKKSDNWFDVDHEGLRNLQESKPKHYILRELIQNAWDEDITTCEVVTSYENELAKIVVVDDSSKGFKDITHAYTIFARSDKISSHKKRGRFNIGEKQAFSICDEVIVETTKGTVIFDKTGRIENDNVLEKGSIITVFVKMTIDEYNDMNKIIKYYLPPNDIVFIVNGININYKIPSEIFNASLKTVIEKNGVIRNDLKRNTLIHLHETAVPWLYEMGIPIIELGDSKYSIDVQQKIPLSIDRDIVKRNYVENLYTLVLNYTNDKITKEESSSSWIRCATRGNDVTKESINNVINLRYGDKVLLKDDNNPVSNDDAISNGYNVVSEKEFSRRELYNIKEHNELKSTSDLFPGCNGIVIGGNNNSLSIDETEYMLKYAEFAKKIAKRLLFIEIDVNFVGNSDKTIGATYGNRTLTVNVHALGESFFNKLTSNLIDITIHELAHEKGHHTEMLYHRTCTELGSKLVIIALEEPDFFNY